MSQPAVIKIKVRTGTLAEWTSANPILLEGELGFISDDLQVIIGNGSSPFLNLIDSFHRDNQLATIEYVETLGGNLNTAIGNEGTARANADNTLQNNIDSIVLDVTSINSNISGLQNDVVAIQTLLGYIDFTLTAKGQILILDEATGQYTPLQVGTDGQVLTADSTLTNGVTWSDIPAPTIALDDITNVDAPTPNTNDLLTYDGTNWVNSTPPTIPGSLNDLNDVNVAPNDLDLLRYDATHSEWINAPQTIPALDDLTDVDVSTATTNDLLKFDGSKWVNSAPTTYGDMYKSTYDTNNDGIVDSADISNSTKQMLTIGRNATGSTLYQGTIVYISGSTGNRPNFVKARANAESTSAGTFGVIVSDILNNNDGYVCTIGTLDNLDTRSTATNPFTTDTLADGDTLYLSPTTAGYVTNVKPSAPNHMVYVGKVVRTSPTQGTIVYRIANGYELAELHDVQANVPTNNDVLYYDSSVAQWKTNSIASVLGYTPANNSTSVQTTRTISTTTPLSGGGDFSANRTIAIAQATTSADGYLSSTDWNTFNNKQTSFQQFRKASRWYNNGLFANANASFTNLLNTIRYVPVLIDQDITISRMAINVVTSATAGSTCRLGIYTNDATTCQPLTRLVDTGTLALDSTGAKSVTGLSVALTKGLYWFAYVSSIGSGTIAGLGTNFILDVKGLSAIGQVGFAGFNQTFTYGALPSTAGTLTEINSTGTICIFYYY